MDELEQFAKDLRRLGFTMSIGLERSGEWSVWVCHDSWVTSEPAQSVVLPQWSGKNLKDVISYTKFWLEQHASRQGYKWNVEDNA